MKMLVKFRNCQDSAISTIITGDEEPQEWYDPEHGMPASLSLKHKTCMLCQELDQKPDDIDIPSIIGCFFDVKNG